MHRQIRDNFVQHYSYLRLFSLLTAIILFIAGCAVDPEKQPWLADSLAHPERVELDESDLAIDRVSYVARYLLPSDDRSKFINNLLEKKSGGCSNCIFSSGLFVSNSASSVTGSGLGVGLMALDMGLSVINFFADGSLDRVSGFVMPKEFNGVAISSTEQAQSLAASYSEAKLISAAEGIGYSISCVYGCDGMRRIYRLISVNPSKQAHYIYKPDDIAVLAIFGEMKEVANPSEIDIAVYGFEPKFTTTPGNQWFFSFGGDPVLDETGQINISIGENGASFQMRKGLEGTKIHRDFLKNIYSDSYSFYGNSDDYPSVIAYEGILYSYIVDSSNGFVKYRLVER
ncbi:hypothetical protein IMCC21906_00699 [Spongiibacter sp. IMCC21906]|nr:hypothetical protein IMCC21906_00699 [Spongiibacter sp. IMCC21906]